MTTKNNIPADYKDSAVGIIPQEWEVRRIQEICKVDAKSLSAKTSPDYEFEYISLSDVDSDSFDISTSHQIFRTAPSRARRIVSKGDVVISTVRPNLQGFFLAKEDKKDLIASTGFAVLTPTECDSQYLLSCFFSQIVGKQFYSLVVGSNYPAVNSSDVAKLKLAVPPMEEQRKIAEILGVWDEAIEKQSRLIEKLELRKRGLMQCLLTGRTRLPGFTTPWQKVSYSEILKEVKRNMTWDDNEEYDLISVKRRSGGLFHRDRLLGKDIKTKNLRPAKFGDFLISKMQIVHGASGLVTEEFDGMKISGSYIALVAKSREKVDMNFINWYSQTPYFYHQTYVSSYGVHIEKMTFDLESFMSMNIMLPPLPEQKAIAEVLTAADNEIVTHRKKLDALRLQKRGLMQQLLTGKIRVKK